MPGISLTDPAAVLSGAAANFGQLYADLAGVKAGVIFERDGILNRVRVERQHQVAPTCFDEFHVMLSARKALEDLKEVGFVLLVTTNQPGISRGYLARRELDLMHARLCRCLPLDGILVCPHDEMDLRKRFEQQFALMEDIRLVATYATAEGTLRGIGKMPPEDRPEIALMDIELPGMSGVEATMPCASSSLRPTC